MAYWIKIASINTYDHLRALREQGYIDWVGQKSLQVGDIVYLYSSNSHEKFSYPRCQLTAKCQVVKKLKPSEKQDDKKYWNGIEPKVDGYDRIELIEIFPIEVAKKLTLKALKNLNIVMPYDSMQTQRQLSEDKAKLIEMIIKG